MSALLMRHVGLPMLFLAVALLGGLRFGVGDGALRFIPPPLATLLLAAATVLLFGKCLLIDVRRDWIGSERPPDENLSNALTLGTLLAATVQVYNAVLPEDALFFTVFAVSFALVLWNNLFVVIRPHRLVASLGGLLLVAFVVKYMLLAALFEPTESLARTIVQSVLHGVTLGGLESEPYARSTGYVAFAALALYLTGLWACAPPPDRRADVLADLLARRDALTDDERLRVIEALAPRQLPAGSGEAHAAAPDPGEDPA